MAAIGFDAGILEAPGWSGVERSASRLAAALAEAGEDVVALSRGEVRWPFPRPPRLLPRPIGGPRPPALWRETALPAALRRERVRLLLSPVAAVPLRTRRPRVAVIHELPWARGAGLERGPRAAIDRARILLAAAVCRLLLVPSEATARDLARLAPFARRRIAVLPWGISEAFLAPPAEPPGPAVRARFVLPPGPFVLWVGIPRRRKGLGDLMAAVRESGPPQGLRVVMAGVEGVFGEGFRGLGWRDDRDLAALYREAAVLAYPSRSEGFGFPPLEAMACGCPVVAARAGSIPEVCGDAALLVPPGDPGALAAALARAIGDSALRADLAARGRRRAAEFSWRRTGERARDLLRAVAP